MFQKTRKGDPEGALSEDQTESSQQYLTRTRRLLILRSVIAGIPHRFDQFSAAVVMDDLLALVHDDPQAPITLILDSEGGRLDDGMMLFDFIRMSPVPITTVGLNCASMTTLLLAAGRTRLLLPHSSLCLHLPEAMFGRADIKDQHIRIEELERTKEEFIGCYIRCGVTAKLAGESQQAIHARILEDIDREFYLDANGAIAYGLADRIATPSELFGIPGELLSAESKGAGD